MAIILLITIQANANCPDLQPVPRTISSGLIDIGSLDKPARHKSASLPPHLQGTPSPPVAYAIFPLGMGNILYTRRHRETRHHVVHRLHPRRQEPG